MVTVQPHRKRGLGLVARMLDTTVYATKEEAEEQVREQRITDAMFNDRTPRLVVLELPDRDGHE